jgi:hypothetical protein
MSALLPEQVRPAMCDIATGDRDGEVWSPRRQYNDNNTIGVLKSTDGGSTVHTAEPTYQR